MSRELSPGAHIHLIAISGVGMASLAGLLKSQGYRISGSDQNTYPPMSIYLERLGIPVYAGYSERHLVESPDLVVIGNAVSRENPEAQAVLSRGIPYLSFPQALGKFLIGSKRSVVVAGTHGKTTTTALLAWVLSCAGADPSFFVGGVPLNFATGFQQGSGDWVALEGDEYDSAFFDKGPKFLHYRPHLVILTSVEFDHADIYRDLEHLKVSFCRLVELIPTQGALWVCNEYEAAREVCRQAPCRVIFYGEGEPKGWEAKVLRAERGKTYFEPRYHGKSDGTVAMPLLGRHNVTNALAVYALGRDLGINVKDLRDAMASFSGVKRRQEIKGTVGGITVIDDFAHHPTAVRETIGAVRSGYPGQRLWAIFEPRSNTSRRRVFQREFSSALRDADRVVVAGVYQPERIPEGERLSPPAIVDEINRLASDHRAEFIERASDIPNYVAEQASAGDVILVMSNGAFDGVQEKILKALEERAR